MTATLMKGGEGFLEKMRSEVFIGGENKVARLGFHHNVVMTSSRPYFQKVMTSAQPYYFSKTPMKI